MADTAVDKLKIEIEASASKAENSVDKLVQYVENLQQAIGKIDTSRLYALSGAITSLGDGLKNIPGQSSFNNLVKGIEKLKGIDTSGIDSVARSVNNLTNANPESLEDLAIGVMDLSQAMRNLPSAQSFNRLVTGLNSLNSTNFSNLGNLANTVGNLANSLSSLNNATGGLQNLTNAVNNASAAMGGVIGNIGNAMRSAANAVRNVLSGLRSAGNAVATVFHGLASAVRVVGRALGSLATFAARVIRRFASMAASLATNRIGFGLLSNAVKTASSTLSTLTSKLGKVTRLFTFMLLRKGITAMFDDLGKAFQHLAQKSSTFNAQISELQASCSMVSHEVASLASTFLSVFGPALNYIINLIATAISYINKLFSALSGKTAFTQAKKVATDYAASLDKASKATKSMLSGIDELNILNTHSGSSGSGSSSLEDCYENAEIPDDVKNLADWLKDMWDNSDFTELGNRLGEGLRNMLDNIPWDEIRAKAGNIGKDLATLINGAIETEGLGYSIGNTLAQGINTAFESLSSFVHNLKWDSLGKFIGESVNGLFENIDWSLINDTFVTGATGIANSLNSFADSLNISAVSQGISSFFNNIIDTVNAFVTTTDWSTIGTKLGQTLSDAFIGIDWGKAGATVGESFKAFFDFISSTVENIDWWQVGESVKNFLVGIDWAGVADSFFEAIGAAIGGLAAFLGGLISEGVDKCGEYFADKITEAGGNIGQGILDGIAESLVNIATWIKEHIFTPFIEGFKNAFGIHSPSTEMMTMGNYIVEGLINGIPEKFSACAEKVVEWATNIKNWFTKDGGINSEKFQSFATNIIDGFKTKVKGYYTSVKTNITAWASKVRTWFTNDGGVNSNKFSTFATNVINGFKEKVGSYYTNVKSNMQRWGNDAATWFKNVCGQSQFTTFATNIVDGFNNQVGAIYSRCKSTIESWASDIVGWFKNKLDINSPSKVFAELGQYTVAGFNDGLEKVSASTTNVMQDWISSFSDMTINIGVGLDVDDSELKKLGRNGINENMSIEEMADYLNYNLLNGNDNYEQMNLMREQNELLKQILDKDISVSGDDVFKVVRKKANEYYRVHREAAFNM